MDSPPQHIRPPPPPSKHASASPCGPPPEGGRAQPQPGPSRPQLGRTQPKIGRLVDSSPKSVDAGLNLMGSGPKLVKGGLHLLESSQWCCGHCLMLVGSSPCLADPCLTSVESSPKLLDPEPISVGSSSTLVGSARNLFEPSRPVVEDCPLRLPGVQAETHHGPKFCAQVCVQRYWSAAQGWQGCLTLHRAGKHEMYSKVGRQVLSWGGGGGGDEILTYPNATPSAAPASDEMPRKYAQVTRKLHRAIWRHLRLPAAKFGKTWPKSATRALQHASKVMAACVHNPSAPTAQST